MIHSTSRMLPTASNTLLACICPAPICLHLCFDRVVAFDHESFLVIQGITWIRRKGAKPTKPTTSPMYHTAAVCQYWLDAMAPSATSQATPRPVATIAA